MYGLKTDLTVIAAGLCIRIGKQEKGNVSGVSIFWKTLVWHRSTQSRTENDVVNIGSIGVF